jgi:serine/threonine protein kinase
LLAVAHKHRYEAAPDPRARNPQIPEGLARLILRCLEKELGKRFQTTEELLADLVAIEEMLPTSDRAPAGRSATKRKSATSKKITVEFIPKKLLIPVAAMVAIVAAIKGVCPERGRNRRWSQRSPFFSGFY